MAKSVKTGLACYHNGRHLPGHVPDMLLVMPLILPQFWCVSKSQWKPALGQNVRVPIIKWAPIARPFSFACLILRRDPV